MSIIMEDPVLISAQITDTVPHDVPEADIISTDDDTLITEKIEKDSLHAADPSKAPEGEGKSTVEKLLPIDQGVQLPTTTRKGNEYYKATTSEKNVPTDVSDSSATPQSKNDQPYIIYVDPVGTRWTFPYEAAKTWDGVRKLVKSIFVNIFVPKWIAADLDDEGNYPGANYSIIKLKPECTTVFSGHWESLVSPGWEFKIEFNRCYILDEIRSEILDRENKSTSDTESVTSAKEKAMSSISDSESEEGTSAKRKARKPASDAGNEEQTLAEEKVMNSIVYVATYLVPDRDGDYRRHETERKDEKIKLITNSDIHGHNNVLEEHREVYFSDSHTMDFDKRMVDTISSPCLYIISPILLDALQAIIDFQSISDEFTPKEWPKKPFRTDLHIGRFVYPFVDLYHYREKLLQYRDVVKNDHDEEYSQMCGEHIGILNEYLESLSEIRLKDSERLHGGPVPKTTFTILWHLLKPGSDVFVRENGTLNAYVIESFQGGIKWHSRSERSSPYEVNVWNLNFDGQHLTRSVKTVFIPVFDHECEINSLPLFPVRFHVNEDPQYPLYQQLVDRGKRFVNMVKAPSFHEYSGPSKLQGIRTYNRTRVVVDHTSQPWTLDSVDKQPNAIIPVSNVYDVELGERTRIAHCRCKTCATRDLRQTSMERRSFDDYDDIDLKSRKNLTDHQYLLCWSHVYGFILKDRVWDILEVSGLRDPRIDKNVIESLVLKPESNKEMIKAVCDIFDGTYPQAFSSDFVRGKGEGQILLLHGPPGTGKTLTAESVAEYTGRPLLSITAADLGHEPEQLEKNLLQFFRNARNWNAIVLLDEADVYLETRSAHDLRRNSIVSVFLRALDYFEGILFLTTNRVGSFDEAFLSRIHVQMGYDPLDEESRQKIWKGYFEKLSKNHENDGQEIRCSYDAKEYIRREKDLRVLEWNGREIRNAFQTAVALACFQAKNEGNRIPELTDEHLRQVVTMSHNFKSYLKAVRGAEEDWAFQARVRNDKAKASDGMIQSQDSVI
ncbi:ATPase AAA-type core [Penicillium nucicola]|uniref:ATPase AAA-type core n=1 Tax=Penicillium nucicola TaxID=1850975 RepID=UPI002545B2FA|nr:ATPase AAA-type core [Penicillium nucicola]KAJ5757129.1 ATPase AAA-type core [Penicillium nucicola]